MTSTSHQIPPRCRPSSGPKLDGRTKLARRLREMRRELSAHLGGAPAPTAVAVIDRILAGQMHLWQMDDQVAGGEPLTAKQLDLYASLSSSVVRSLRLLGLRAAKPPAPTAADVLAYLNREAAA